MQYIVIYFVGILLAMLGIGAYRGYMALPLKDLPLEFLVILWPVVAIFVVQAFAVCCAIAMVVSLSILFHNGGRFLAVKVRQFIQP